MAASSVFWHRKSVVDRSLFLLILCHQRLGLRLGGRERQCDVLKDSILEIVGHGAWNGGTVQDNSIYENKGMFFKGDIPVNDKSIQDRMGVKTRVVAPEDERIGVTAMSALLEENLIDPSKIKLVIGATNVGEDKYDPGPLIKTPYELIRNACPNAMVLDLYAGCPGFQRVR